MPQMMIRYKVKPDQVERNVALLRDFFTELHAIQPDHFRYAVFQLDDEVSFVHLAHTKPGAGAGPLPTLPAYRRFRTTVEQRCDGASRHDRAPRGRLIRLPLREGA